MHFVSASLISFFSKRKNLKLIITTCRRFFLLFFFPGTLLIRTVGIGFRSFTIHSFKATLSPATFFLEAILNLRHVLLLHHSSSRAEVSIANASCPTHIGRLNSDPILGASQHCIHFRACPILYFASPLTFSFSFHQTGRKLYFFHMLFLRFY